MLKGLAITPPVVGRISIGRVVERNGKRLPEKDDQFTLTSHVQNRDGGYCIRLMKRSSARQAASCARCRYGCCSTTRP